MEVVGGHRLSLHDTALLDQLAEKVRVARCNPSEPSLVCQKAEEVECGIVAGRASGRMGGVLNELSFPSDRVRALAQCCGTSP